MMTFFLVMTLYPDVQKKAQQEIDSVIGSDRLPSINDRDQLPYIRALVSELFRWNPTIPLGTTLTTSVYSVRSDGTISRYSPP